jgi:predicted ArsR family transcriptional regulator
MYRDTDPGVLADPTRRAILAALRNADVPLGVGELASALGRHRNSVRDQLRRLEAAGLVRISRGAPAGRGRPALRYAAVPVPEDPYRILAGVLADQVASSPDAAAASQAAGERWGRAAVSGRIHAAAAPGAGPGPSLPGAGPGPSAPGATDATAVEALTGLLAEAGFAPEPVTPGAVELRLRDCPFLPIDHHRLPVVCGIHLGFIRGALRGLGSSLDAIAIEPFVRPDLCVARIGSRDRA